MRQQFRSSRLIVGLGTAQLLAWGALYYGIGVIGDAMSVDLGAPLEQVFGAFTWALVVSGLSAPLAGRLVDRHGGRISLLAGAVLGALGFLVLAYSRTSVGLFVGWSINGLAMALGLYEACFATLGQVAPREYSRLVTSVTLIAGFSSTVTWPASYYLLQAIGWRSLCFVYAGTLGLCAGLYAVMLPRWVRPETTHRAETQEALSIDPGLQQHVRILAWTFAGMALVSGAVSAHLLTVLKASRVADQQAVWLASSVGVMQVVGRLLQVTFGLRDAVRLGLFTFVGFFASAVLLLASMEERRFVFAFAVFYGVANGLVTIVKATLPVQILGAGNIGHVLGTFSRPALMTRAIAPWLFAVTVTAQGVYFAVLGIVVIGGVTLGTYVAATSKHRRGGEG